MAWECIAGSTLYIPTGPRGDHLFVILNDPLDFEGCQPQSCILVNFSTIRGAIYDKTLEIQGNKQFHPFVKDPSYVYYKGAKLECAAELLRRVEQKLFATHTPIPQEGVDKIINGLNKSAQCPKYIKALKLKN